MEEIRVASMRFDPHGRNSEVNWVNLLPTEREAIEAAGRSAAWVRLSNGRLEVSEALDPPRFVDKKLEGHWTEDGTRFDTTPTLDARTCALVLEGVGDKHAKHFAAWGFVCFRSRRRADGSFSERWELPFVEAADGELREAIVKDGSREQYGKFKAATAFLLRRGGFGRLSIVTHFAAMVID